MKKVKVKKEISQVQQRLLRKKMLLEHHIGVFLLFLFSYNFFNLIVAPEVIELKGAVFESDIWSLGLIFIYFVF
jgi:hypothetical protein